jgi:hypothetical protein
MKCSDDNSKFLRPSVVSKMIPKEIGVTIIQSYLESRAHGFVVLLSADQAFRVVPTLTSTWLKG